MKDFLEEKVDQYNRIEFIVSDPISIPHQFKKKQDIEIAGLFSAVLAWGQRSTIIRKSRELMALMDGAPHDFLCNHKKKDLKRFAGFRHRTFNLTDAIYFIEFLSNFYLHYESLESAFLPAPDSTNIRSGLTRFQKVFFKEEFPLRTRKHISTPDRNSACKRLNMYLRWMVRKDERGVDFGIWKNISPAQLICPCDVHVERVARRLKLIKSKKLDWMTAVELTENLKQFDPIDPVKYDFALFGLGVEGKF